MIYLDQLLKMTYKFNFDNPILVLGANGFTGKFVCLELKKRKINFVANVRPKSNIEWVKANNIKYRYSDVSSKKQLKTALEGCRAVLNISSIGFGNAKPVVDACEEMGIDRVVFISSTSIFTYLNAKSKLLRKEAEKIIMQSKLNWTILRPTMIFGTPNDRNISRLILWIDKYPIIPIFGNGNSLQQPVYVKDVAWSAVEVLNQKNAFKNDFNISGRVSITYNQMIDQISVLLNKNIFKIYLPGFLFAFILSCLEKIGIYLPIKGEQIRRLNENKAFSHKKAQDLFGYSPSRFENVIKKEINLLKRKQNFL